MNSLRPIAMRVLLALFVLCGGCFAAFAQGGEVTQTRNDGKSVTVYTPTGSITITPFSPYIIRVLPQLGKASALPKETASVVLAANEKYSVTESKNDITVTTSAGLSVRVDRKTGKVIFESPKNKVLTEYSDVAAKGNEIVYRFSNSGIESFYGGGERGQSVDLAGDTLIMYNKQNYGYGKGDRTSQMNITVPLYISSRGYGIFFDDYSASKLILGNPIEYISPRTQPIPYFFILSTDKSITGVTSNFTRLTGRQDLAPFWSLGYITSKYGYKTQDETIAVVDTLKRNGYPLDGIVLDIYWYGKETDMGRYDWMPSQWNNPKKMLADLKDKGVKMVLISQPYLNKIGAIDNYNMAKEAGMLGTDSLGNVHDVTTWVGDAGMLDVSNPKTREWMWSRYKDLTDQGVTGWWGDLGEPEVHPLTMKHHSGESAAMYHNRYGNDWSRIIYDGFKNEYPNTRLMSLMRGGTAGLQRYSVFPWSTDVSRSWGGLQAQIPIMINSALSGLGYMSHDVGGFAVDKENPTDAELYARWLQLGLFTPVLRTHSTVQAEPYHYAEYQDLFRSLIKARYKWLPYNYTLAYENALNGTPLVRSMNYLDSENHSLANIDNQYFWGENVLIAPILDKGATSRTVILPEGKWYDYNKPRTTYNGNTTITYSAPISVIPVLVRAGAIIPSAEYEMQSTDDYNPTDYTLTYFPTDGRSSYTLYEDDRTSTGTIEKGDYSLIECKAENSAKTLTFSVTRNGDYKGMPTTHSITLNIVNFSAAPKKVAIDGKPLATNQYSYSPTTKQLTIKFTISKSATIKVTK